MFVIWDCQQSTYCTNSSIADAAPRTKNRKTCSSSKVEYKQANKVKVVLPRPYKWQGNLIVEPETVNDTLIKLVAKISN